MKDIKLTGNYGKEVVWYSLGTQVLGMAIFIGIAFAMGFLDDLDKVTWDNMWDILGKKND